jgi:2-keto-3-deoxy-L-rhamnonate aldolase RhmA
MSYGTFVAPEKPSLGRASLRQTLNEGPVTGTFQLIGHPAVTELLALAGAEVIVIDAEHAALDVTTLEGLVRAGDARGASVVIRVPEIGSYLSRSLDMGAAGVVVPMVESAPQALAVVAATRFPPLGARGLGASRAALFGLDIPAYRARANDEVLVVAMIESRAGLDAAASIAAVEGIDAIFVGPTDLASSLGAEAGSPEHRAAITAIFDAARAAGRHFGIHCADADDARRYAELGARLLLIGTDAQLFADNAASVVNAVRSP